MSNLVGKTLGKYRIVASLGHGGMAEVYKAYQPSLKRHVAIKVLHSHLAQDEYFEDFKKRFIREATAVARLRHPNIVTMFDFEVADTLYYMVMEFIEGPTLQVELHNRANQGKPFTLLEIAKIFNALADAIDYAHIQGTIHRDLKPANIMITPTGQVVLTDFGIARMVGTQHQTMTSTVVGTPAYMSPEQGLGEEIDGRSDIYSLSVILYEMVTGQVPFDGDTPLAVMMKHVSTPVPDPRKISPKTPDLISRIMLKGLAKKPEDRYNTASDMANDVLKVISPTSTQNLVVTPLTTLNLDRQSLDGNSEGKTSSADPSATTSPIRRQNLLPWAIVLVLLTILGTWWGISAFGNDNRNATVVSTSPALAMATATQVWLVGDDDRDGISNQLELEFNTLPDKRDTDEDGVDDGDEVNLWQTDPLLPDSDQDGLKDGVEISQGLNPLSPDSDHDGLYDNQDPEPLQPVSSVSSPSLTATTTPQATSTSSSIGVSPTSTSLSVLTATATITASTSGPDLTATQTPTPTSISVSPSPTPAVRQPTLTGKLAYHLEAGSESGIYIFDLRTGSRTLLVPYGNEPKMAPDGTRLTWQEEPGIAWYKLDTNQRFTISEDIFDRDPAISYDGQKVAYINNTALYIWSDSGIRNVTAADQSPAWSPDGVWLLFTTNSEDIFKVRVDGQAAPIVKLTDNATNPAWGPDFRIAFVRDGDIYLMDQDGNNQTQLTNHTALDYDPAWSPDGRYLVFISERNGNPEIYVMNVNGSNIQRITNTPTQTEASPTWGRN